MRSIRRIRRRNSAPRRALASQHPADWPFQITLQDPLLQKFHLGQEWDDAIAAYRRSPDPLLGQLLEARLIGGLHRKRSREMLDRVLAAALDSPWIHLALVEWATHPLGGDPALAATHMEEFRP